MGSTQTSGYNKNRRRRIYPYVGRIAKTPVNFEYSQANSQIGEQSFTASVQEVFSFPEAFTNVPVVILTTTQDSSVAGIIPRASSLSTTSVTIDVSDTYTGTVYVLAVDITPVYVGDANRFRKNYPSFYRVPVYGGAQGGAAGSTVTTETATVSFSAQTSVTYNFVSSFSAAPNVVITAGEDASSAGIVVYVSAVSASSVTIEASESFTGVVYVHATEA